MLKVNELDKIIDTSVKVVDRNRWFIVTLFLLVIIAFLISSNVHLSNKAAENIQIVYVKMFPDGTWDVDYHSETREVEFIKRTIDSLLMSYVLYRFTENPKTIKSFWAKAQHFMSTDVYNYFISPNGFDAVGKASHIETCGNCSFHDVDVTDVVHIEYDQSKTNGTPSKTYRTNIYFKEIGKAPNGSPLKDGVVERIASIHWRIKTRKEIEAIAGKNINIIKKINPIGLEVIKEDIISPK